MTYIRQAILLAAGKGTRMGTLTAETPKPMLQVAGKPLVEHVIRHLGEAGIERFLVVTGYLGEQIRGHLKNYPAEIEFLEQKVVNGTGAAALLGAEFAGGEPFVLTFGDILCRADDYRGLMTQMEGGVSAVLGVKHVEDPAAGAAVYEERGRVTRIVEKPPPGTSTTNWNSAGLYAFTAGVFEELRHIPLSPRGEYEITSAVAQMLERGDDVRLYAIAGEWMDVGRPQDLAAAARLLRGAEGG